MKQRIYRAITEIGFILFLFYANLLSRGVRALGNGPDAGPVASTAVPEPARP